MWAEAMSLLPCPHWTHWFPYEAQFQRRLRRYVRDLHEEYGHPVGCECDRPVGCEECNNIVKERTDA